jgi:hypothetical protein
MEDDAEVRRITMNPQMRKWGQSVRFVCHIALMGSLAGLVACSTLTAPAPATVHVDVTVFSSLESGGVNPPLPSGTQPPPVIADPYGLIGPCNREECLLARADFPAGMLGIAHVRGYYGTVARTGMNGEQRTCDAFTVVSGSKNLIERYLALLDSRNTVNNKDESGQLVLALSLGPLTVVDREAITASTSLSPVNVLVMPIPRTKDEVCPSFVEVLRIDPLPPAGQTTYTDSQLGITLQYPSAWQPDKTDIRRYSGDDGFFMATSSVMGWSTAQEACASEAEANKKGNQFGQRPTAEMLHIEDHLACLVMPSDDQPASEQGIALLVVEYPVVPGQPQRLLALFADKAHIRDIGQSIRFTEPKQQNQTQLPTR